MKRVLILVGCLGAFVCPALAQGAPPSGPLPGERGSDSDTAFYPKKPCKPNPDPPYKRDAVVANFAGSGAWTLCPTLATRTASA
jgi:hypothetical protein